MTRRCVNIKDYLVPVDGFTQAVVVPGPPKMIFVSGLTARQGDGSIAHIGDAAGQTREILESLSRILEAAEASPDDVVRMVTYLVDMADHESVHRIRTEYFGGAPPASTSVEVSQLYDHRQLVEMEFTAVVPQVHSNL